MKPKQRAKEKGCVATNHVELAVTEVNYSQDPKD
jgi:hypothetical protein